MKEAGKTNYMIYEKLVRPIAVMSIGLLIICVVWRITLQNSFTLHIPDVEDPGQEVFSEPLSAAGAGQPVGVNQPAGVNQPVGMNQPAGENQSSGIEKSDGTGNYGSNLVEITPRGEDQLEFGKPESHDGYIEMQVRPKETGEPGDFFYMMKDPDAEESEEHHFLVGRFGTIFDENTGNFTGDTIVLFSAVCFFLGVAFVMLRFFCRMRGEEMYSYYAVYAAGFSLFSGITGLLLLHMQIRHVLSPHMYPMRIIFTQLSSAPFEFMRLTAPLLLLFSVLLLVSNLALLRHEPPRFQNLLGILASLCLIAGDGLGLFLYLRSGSGSPQEMIGVRTAVNVYCTAFVYFECMLAGAVICGLRAALHQPSADRDYIIILGCRFRRDGSLTPLLKGRCDRAIEFWRKQKEKTGKEAVLIPSGGQGPDESMPEAQAMARYLFTQGVPETAVLLEDQSRNTYQNMAFSKALIEKDRADARVVFSTTNYHVFRSGVWASLAGLRAEGIGSRTKWWFWPNAFLRECVGLLANRIRQEILLLVILAVYFTALTWIFGI